jgi:DNA topoisomerase-1
MTIGQTLHNQEMIARQSFSRPPARYNEASLVRTLEEMGIGRPSTYAPTIDTIQQRGYVIKEDREGTPREVRQLTLSQGNITTQVDTEVTGAEKNKLFPTDIAGVVNDFLVKNFGDVLDYHFTAKVETEFDEIAQGQQAWQDMLENFYHKFHPKVEGAENLSREEAGQARQLGQDPKTGLPVLVKIGRFGPYVQLGEAQEGEEKPKFASLKPGQKMDTIKLEEALELFKLPRTLGTMPENFEATAADGTVFSVSAGQTLIAKQGPFGPYLEYGDKQFAPIKGYDPLSITLEEAVFLIEAKIQADADKIVRSFAGSTVKILNGRWGPYITDVSTKVNAKIAKTEDPMSLSLEDCLQRLSEAPPPKKRGRAASGAKKPSAPKATSQKATAKKTTSKKVKS